LKPIMREVQPNTEWNTRQTHPSFAHLS